MPAPDKADEIFGTLVNAGAHLVSQAVRQHEGVQTVRTKLRQAALTALAERPTDRWEQIWRGLSGRPRP
ncbi:hypothetical protein [Streptomyces mirabilis]|uniref:hypothetical protein n=1 Tax=Streptomyces mirabilis TaxID=68239 RepID=UPI0036DF76D3